MGGVFKGVGVTVEGAFLEVVEGAGGDVVALLVGEEGVACEVDADARRGAHAGGHGCGLAGG